MTRELYIKYELKIRGQIPSNPETVAFTAKYSGCRCSCSSWCSAAGWMGAGAPCPVVVSSHDAPDGNTYAAARNIRQGRSVSNLNFRKLGAAQPAA